MAETTIYISVVTHAIDLPLHLHIFQEYAFNGFIQCVEDYPLMYKVIRTNDI